MRLASVIQLQSAEKRLFDQLMSYTPSVELPRIGAAEWYVDRGLWAVEKECVFAHAWQYAGLTTQISRAGDYFTCFAGHIPVIVVRDEDGSVNAFVNVCRHRGHEVVTDDSGRRKTLQCRYHGWTYGLDGSLRVARRSEQDPEFEKKRPDGLFPLKVETWGALIFVNPDLDAPALPHFFGEWQERVLKTGIDVGTLTEYERRSYTFEANWKVLVENTLECYHCAICHPGLAKLWDVSEDFWFDEYEYFSAYGAATRAEDIQQREEDSIYLKQAAQSEDALASWLWPNVFFSVFPGGGAMVATAQPDPFNTGRCVYARQYCFGADTDEDVRREFMALFDQVVYEDQGLCASVQRGFNSGYYEQGPLMPQSEPGIIHFNKLLHRVILG